MTRRHLSLLFALAAVPLAAGCGASESQSAATGTPTSTSAATSSTGEQPAATTTTSSSTTQTETGAGTTTTTTTGQGGTSGGQPAFVEPGKTAEGVAAAEAALRAHGYTPFETATYKPQQTLRVLLGSKAGGENAFFFVGGRYIGTDSKTPSTQVSVVAQSEGSVTLRYTLYSQGKPAGSSTVTFQLENGSLQAQQTIPPPAKRTAG